MLSLLRAKKFQRIVGFIFENRLKMAAPIGHAQLSGSQVPQHSTFAHSKEDVLNALSFYFGQPTSPEKLKDYNEHHAATYHFPDAYAGSNT